MTGPKKGPRCGCAFEIEGDADQIRIHAVSIGPPLDPAAICGWRYQVEGLDVDRDWMATKSVDRCGDCLAVLGDSWANTPRLPRQAAAIGLD
jgi:hypothetical protein